MIGLHVLSDLAIALAYFSIPIVLLRFLQKRRDIQFPWLFGAFALFILACGATHVMDVITLWRPLYRLAGVLKAVTAIVSVGTAITLIRLWPSLLRLPTMDQLQFANDALAAELHHRRAVEKALADLNSELCLQANQNKERFRTTFENAAIGLAHVAPDGHFLLVNDRLCQMLGYSREELISRGFPEITHPDDLQEDWSLANSLLAGERETYSMQKRYLHRNGAVIWGALHVSLIRDDNQAPAYFIAAVQDITTKKEAEERLQQIAAALAEREQQLQLVFERADLGDWKWDIIRDELVAHPIVLRQYGYPALSGPLPSARFIERQHPEDRKTIQTSLQEALAHSSRFDLEFRVVLPDNSIRWLACRGTVVRDDQGRPIGTQGINLDITASKEAEIAVRASEAQLLLLTEVLPQMLWFTAANGDAEFFNQRWYEYTGQTPDQALNWGWQPVIHPDDLERSLRIWRNSLCSGETYDIEYRLRAADGTYRWHLGRAIPLRDESGQITRWFGSFTDIHDLKVSEASLRSFHEVLEEQVAQRTTALLNANEAALEARGKLQSVLDSAKQVAIITLNKDGVLEIFNRGAEHLTLWSANDVVGRYTPAVYVHPDELITRQEEFFLRTGQRVTADELFKVHNLPNYPYSFETRYLRRDGSQLYVSVSFAPILDSYGRRVGTVIIAVDISEGKKLNLQLEELNAELIVQSQQAMDASRTKSQFLAAMSHEIRTPMNAILGIAELLGETDLTARQRQYVEVFQKSGSTLLTLINDILDLSKIESGQFELEKVEFDLEDLVERTIDLIRPKAHTKKIALSIRISPQVPNAFVGDPNRLQQILLNLLGNAIKFTEKGSVCLAVTMEGPGNPVHFEVQDTGIGISEDKLESIFEDFKQAESSTTRRFGGTGLGLGIARRLVQRMGGMLGVRSQPGKGSTFYFDAVLEAGTQASVWDEEDAASLLGARILIVDNNVTNRLIFSELCNAWGMLTTQCSLAPHALELMDGSSQAPFDLLLVDDRMPEMDGFHFLSLLKERGLALPAVMVTSDSIPGDETRAKKLGVSGYGVKPLRRSELKRLLRNALSGKKRNGALSPSASVQAKPAKGLHQVLIAEDSEDNRFLVEAYLKGSDYLITFVRNGQEAVTAMETECFDLVLMDVQMPVMDGLTATRLIREAEAARGEKRVPILALTANAMNEDVQASQSAGCTAHLGKPISKQKLLAALKEYLPSL